MHVEKRINEIVNRLNKTKREEYPDLQAQRVARDRELRLKDRKEREKREQEEKRQKEQWQKEKEERDDGRIFEASTMKSNQMDVADVNAAEEDFM